MMTKKEVLIDGDIIPYACGFAAEETTYETEDGEVHSTPTKAKKHIESLGLCNTIIPRTEAEPVSHALRLAKNMVRGIVDTTKASSHRVFLTGDAIRDGVDPNFRIETATIQIYKGNRKQPKPLHYTAIRDYLIRVFDAEITNGYEADDALGINQTESTIIATIDKDLDMIPGYHYNWNKANMYCVSDKQAMRFFYTQLLTGDNTDNIRGLPGIGPHRAKKLLAKCVTEEDLFWKCVCCYEDHLSVDPTSRTVFPSYREPYKAMLETGKLLWIMRNENEPWETPF